MLFNALYDEQQIAVIKFSIELTTLSRLGKIEHNPPKAIKASIENKTRSSFLVSSLSPELVVTFLLLFI